MPAHSRRARASKETDAPDADVAAKKEPTMASLSNSDRIELLSRGKMANGEERFGSALRGADVIEESGVLDAFKSIKNVEVPASERDRTIDDDAVLVMQGLADLSPEQIEQMKENAYNHEEGQAQVKESLEAKHYGSEDHKQYGALVERLTGGVISAEEAMAMNPTGGLIGPGVSILRHLDGIDSLKRHAMRHDATGFLKTRFGVGPGYGSKTSAIGRQSDDPLAGQIFGWAREIGEASDFEDHSHVGTSGRFNEGKKKNTPT